PGGARRRRLRTYVHVDPRCSQTRGANRHLRGARPDARRGHARRGDEPHRHEIRRRMSAVQHTPTQVRGIVDVTPDSFSDGGQWFDDVAAVTRGNHLLAGGADLLDIGGESTRPGATRVAPEEELRRVLPVLIGLADAGAPLSVDTMRAVVAGLARAAGACSHNGDSEGEGDLEMTP